MRRLYGLPEQALIDMGDFVGGMIKYLRAHPVPRVTIAGGIAKMTKLAQGRLDLHSRRGEVDLADLAERVGAGGGEAAGRADRARRTARCTLSNSRRRRGSTCRASSPRPRGASPPALSATPIARSRSSWLRGTAHGRSRDRRRPGSSRRPRRPRRLIDRVERGSQLERGGDRLGLRRRDEIAHRQKAVQLTLVTAIGTLPRRPIAASPHRPRPRRGPDRVRR